MSRALIASCLLIGGALAAPPSLPTLYSQTVTWTMTVEGQTYAYEHDRAYDLVNQQYRDNTVQSGKVTMTLLEKPSSDGYAVQYDNTLNACQSWKFTSLIDGFPLIHADMLSEGQEDVEGAPCDVFSNLNFEDRTFDYRVWVNSSTSVPVKVFSSDAKLQGIDNGEMKISKFTTKVDPTIFDLQDAWGCKLPEDPTAAALRAPPSLPVLYSQTVTWTTTVDGQTYSYEHDRAYDLVNQHYRDDTVRNGVVVNSLLEMPNKDEGYAIQYDRTLDVCVSWEFTSLIDGFPLIYPDMLAEDQVEVDGVLCNVWSNLNSEDRTFDYRVWVNAATGIPVKVYTSDAQAQGIDNGEMKISNFETDVDPAIFLPDSLGCPKTSSS